MVYKKLIAVMLALGVMASPMSVHAAEDSATEATSVVEEYEKIKERYQDYLKQVGLAVAIVIVIIIAIVLFVFGGEILAAIGGILAAIVEAIEAAGAALAAFFTGLAAMIASWGPQIADLTKKIGDFFNLYGSRIMNFFNGMVQGGLCLEFG